MSIVSTTKEQKSLKRKISLVMDTSDEPEDIEVNILILSSKTLFIPSLSFPDSMT